MTKQSLSYVRHGRGAVRPYIHGPSVLPEFIKEVFGATELERHEFGANSFHVELQIEDAVIAIEAGELPDNVQPWINTIYVYVKDVDSVFRKALELGAEPVSQVEEKPYQERQAAFRDSGGNIWWVAKYTPPS